MIFRPALIGLSVAMLAGSAFAGDASSPMDQTGSGFSTDEGSDPGIGRAAAMRRHRPVRRDIVALVPPPRPIEMTAAAQPATVQTAAAQPASAHVSLFDQPLASGSEEPGTQAATVPASGAFAVVTPSLPASTIAVVTVLPPLRPSLPAGEAARTVVPSAPAGDAVTVDAASSLPDVMATPTGKFVYVLPPARPAFRADETASLLAVETPVQAEAPPSQPSLFSTLFGIGTAPAPVLQPAFSSRGHNGLDGLITTYARLNGVPEALVHRVVIRESKYNPRAVGHGGALGLMQIKHGTARALGYDGPASGLLDAETNLTYAVKYLAGAYRTAGGDFDRSVQYYARGYYYAAKHRDGAVRYAGRHGKRGERQDADAGAGDTTVVAAAQPQ